MFGSLVSIHVRERSFVRSILLQLTFFRYLNFLPTRTHAMQRNLHTSFSVLHYSPSTPARSPSLSPTLSILVDHELTHYNDYGREHTLTRNNLPILTYRRLLVARPPTSDTATAAASPHRRSASRTRRTRAPSRTPRTARTRSSRPALPRLAVPPTKAMAAPTTPTAHPARCSPSTRRCSPYPAHPALRPLTRRRRRSPKEAVYRRWIISEVV
jgi:hypothetical protein